MQLVDSLFLFKALIKDGCKWHGDVVSRKWSEELFFEPHAKEAVLRTLAAYKEGDDYKLELSETCGSGAVWIA